MDFASIYGIAVTTVYALNFLIALTIIFGKGKKPTASLAWLMILFALPGVGLLLYSVLSQDFSRRKNFCRNSNEKMVNSEFLKKQMRDASQGKLKLSSPETERWLPLIRLNQKCAYAYFSQDNEVQLFTDGSDFMQALLRTVDEAHSCIHAEYYIIKPDDTGNCFLNHLIMAAKRGVKVQLLMDGMGCIDTDRKLLEELKRSGGKICFFLEPRIFRFNLDLNYRNHRKILVADGKIAFTGGSNIGDEYRGISKKYGGWRDTNLRLSGGCVRDLDVRFALDWKSAAGEEYAPKENTSIPERSGEGEQGIQIISSGPDSTDENIKMSYLTMIHAAKKSILLQTPYLVPDDSILESLKAAALSGVDVRIMIPNRPDHIFVYWASYHNAGSLLSSGVKIYIYEQGFLHAKTLTIDEEITSIGSANFDIRSFCLNFETNALIYDRHTAVSQANAFRADMESSRQLTPALYKARPVNVKFKEAISRLISSLL